MSFDTFMVEATRIHRQRFDAARVAAKATPGKLAPMFYVPLVPITLKSRFEAGMSAAQALDDLDAAEARINEAMCRAEAR